jgi:uncharacterized protein YndB with AHSA1/START domain
MNSRDRGRASASPGGSVAAELTIDERAPAIARAEVEIEADLDTVWDVLTAIDDWPSWNPDVKSASLSGAVAEGSKFRWKAGPGTLTSTIQRVDRPRFIGWTGTTLGIKGIHVWRFEPRNGTTFASTEESWDGLIVRLFRGPMQKTLKKATDAGLQHLKVEAERRAGKT